METYKIENEEYIFICSVHDLIYDKVQEARKIMDTIVKAEEVAKEMGQNMERAIIDRNDKIANLEMELDIAKEKMKKYRAKIKSLKGA